ncbi:unnamed protein product, partial [Discosporangium mesarthrocarpum]
QRVYRGHCSRLLHGARLAIHKSLARKEAEAATRIQTLARSYLAKKEVSRLARKRQERRINDARLWKETWSEDAEAWFYHNAATGEALWEPPRTGYTKHNEKLVLITGEVMEDPLSGEAHRA